MKSAKWTSKCANYAFTVRTNQVKRINDKKVKKEKKKTQIKEKKMNNQKACSERVKIICEKVTKTKKINTN